MGAFSVSLSAVEEEVFSRACAKKSLISKTIIMPGEKQEVAVESTETTETTPEVESTEKKEEAEGDKNDNASTEEKDTSKTEDKTDSADSASEKRPADEENGEDPPTK